MSNSNTNLQTQTSSVLQNDTVSSCSISKVQEKTQLSRIKCMNSLRAIQSQLKFLIETLQDFGNMHIFKRTFSQDLDLLENHLTKEIMSQIDCKTTLTKLRTTFENAFNSELKARMQNYTRYDAQSFYDAMIFNMDSLGKYMLELILHQQRTPQLLKQKKLMQTQEDHSHPIPALNVDSLKVDLVVIQNTCSKKEDSNSETTSSKLVKECSLNFEIQDIHAIKYKMSKAKERCMAYFRSLHSHLQVLLKDDLKGTRIEYGFRRAFMSIFGQDADTFTRTMLLNVDQLQKKLDKDEFQEDGSITGFWVVNNQFQTFIDSKFTLDYDSQMTDTYIVKYTGLEVQHFRDTLLQHLGNVKKSVSERTRHQTQYELMKKRRVSSRDHEYNYHINGTSTTIPLNSFRFLNHGALKIEADVQKLKSWSLSSVEEVKDLKTLIRIMPLWSTGILLSALIGMLSNFTVLQALTMDRHLFSTHFKIPAASYLFFNTIATSISLSILDRLIFPMWQHLTGRSLTPLQQIGAGHVLNVVAMVSSAFLEVQRLHVARVHHLMGARTGVTTIVPFSALWLVGPLTVLGISEALHFPAQVSLYYQEFPTSLRNTSTAMISLLIASGFYVSTAITSLIRNNTGWLMDDINNGRLDIVYSVLAAIGALNFGYFLICANTFQHKLDNHDHNLADVSNS
ncbi:major facilitator superfamily domain, general substrate transporter [Tanacetum coccineum]